MNNEVSLETLKPVLRFRRIISFLIDMFIVTFLSLFIQFFLLFVLPFVDMGNSIKLLFPMSDFYKFFALIITGQYLDFLILVFTSPLTYLNGLILFLYYVFLPSRFEWQTVGRKIMGIRVVQLKAGNYYNISSFKKEAVILPFEKPTIGILFMREIFIVYLFNILTCNLFITISGISSAFNLKHLSIHDKVSNTFFIYAKEMNSLLKYKKEMDEEELNKQNTSEFSIQKNSVQIPENEEKVIKNIFKDDLKKEDTYVSPIPPSIQKQNDKELKRMQMERRYNINPNQNQTNQDNSSQRPSEIDLIIQQVREEEERLERERLEKEKNRHEQENQLSQQHQEEVKEDELDEDIKNYLERMKNNNKNQ